MEESQALEAALLFELQRAEVALDGCRQHGNVSECLEPTSRSYLGALRAFSDLILNGKMPERTKVAD
jgi:hypothetical protein